MSDDSASVTNLARGLRTTSTSGTERELESPPKSRSSAAARSAFRGTTRTDPSGSWWRRPRRAKRAYPYRRSERSALPQKRNNHLQTGSNEKNVQPLLNFQIGFVKCCNLINVLKNLVQEMCRSIEFLNFESGGKLTSSKVFLNWSWSRQCGIRSFSKKIYSKLKPVKLFVKHS